MITIKKTETYWRLTNSKKEKFWVFWEKPNWFCEWLYRGNYGVFEKNDFWILEFIIIQSNEKRLQRNLWNDNVKRFPISLLRYLTDNLRFNIVQQNWLKHEGFMQPTKVYINPKSI